MSPNPHAVTAEFEKQLCEYTGAPFAVATTSCSMALLLAVAWQIRNQTEAWSPFPTPDGQGEYSETVTGKIPNDGRTWRSRKVFPAIEIPKRTYLSVPMSIIHAGGRPTFRDEDWLGAYQLKPLPVWDSARWFTSGMYNAENADKYPGRMLCVSFHASKTLGLEQGGAILHDDPQADEWLRRARFDGRKSGVPPQDDKGIILGWHAYLNPSTAAALILRLYSLPRHNEPLPNDPYPDLSQLEIFR